MVVRYVKVKLAPAVSFVAGQSARGRSRPRYAESPPLHSLPSGISCRSRPFTSGTRRLSHSVNDWAPLTAMAALHAAVRPWPPSGLHAYTRLTGLFRAP